MLRNEAPFGPLRVRALCFTTFPPRVTGAREVEALAADMAHNAGVRRLSLTDADMRHPAVLDAVVDAALACQLQSFSSLRCGLSPASAPALARLFRGGSLTQLSMLDERVLRDVQSAVILGDALRASTSLTRLTLSATSALLLHALVAHGTLQFLHIKARPADDANNAALGAALGALVASNAPALRELKLPGCGLGDAALAPLVQALRHNTHLHTLHVARNGLTGAFARDVLLPAVRANTSLRALPADHDAGPYVREAEAVVMQRAAAP
jgi:hypothetical protein